MSIGAGVLLFVIGAILRFALTVQLGWIDVLLVGDILMGAGAVVFVLGLIFTFRRRRSTSTQQMMAGPGDREKTIRRTEKTDESGL